MTHRLLLHIVLLAALTAACGSDTTGTDPGGGTKRLFVEGHVDYEDGAAEFRISVQLAGAPVATAEVTVESSLGKVLLAAMPDGNYAGVQAGWGDEFALEVTVGDDWLDARINAPDPIVLVAPDLAASFDPHLAPDLLVRVAWEGELADEVRVKTKDFDTTVRPDMGEIFIPAASFKDDEQDLHIDRKNVVALAGGAPGSSLDAEFKFKTKLSVTNPF